MTETIDSGSVEMSRTERASSRAYYVIDVKEDAGNPMYRVWERTSFDRVARLVGEYRHLSLAKASVSTTWTESGVESLEAWGFSSYDGDPRRPSAE